MGQVSPEIGMRLWQELHYHDDGVMDKGGESCGIIGKMGTGKSTIMLQLAQLSRYIPDGSKKKMVARLTFGEASITEFNTYPETVVWRGRANDYWNCLIPQNWNKSFPNAVFNSKPVTLWVHEDDELTFFHADYDGQPKRVPNLPRVNTYYNADDLISKLVDHHINVVYEPQTYIIDKSLIRKIKARTLDGDGSGSDRESTPRKAFQDACPPVFWFEFIGKIIINKPIPYLTLMIDEFHQIAVARAEKQMWKLIDIFASNFVDLRRNNITVIFATHQTTFIDWRIYDRLAKWIWIPGAYPSNKLSMVYPSVIARQKLGMAIIEERLSEFGWFKFSRIHKQPPLLRVGGILE